MRINDNAQPAKRSPTHRAGDLVDDGVDGGRNIPSTASVWLRRSLHLCPSSFGHGNSVRPPNHHP